MILSGLKAERLFSYFFFFFLSQDPFYLDNLKLMELISWQFKSQTLWQKRPGEKLFYFSTSIADLKGLFSQLSEANI